MSPPLVSVLVCSYNAEQFIESTVQSILGQTYRNMELLILDNASTDTTVKLLEQIQKTDSRLIIIASKTNHGAYPGLNHLLEKAKGTYIAINDHDDIWHSQKLEKQIAFLESNKKYVGCGTAIINWYEEYKKGILRTQPKEFTIAWHTSLVYRNEGFRYDISKPVGTDFFFMQNIVCKNGKKIFNFPEPYVLRRIWKGQKNFSSSWMKKMEYREIFNLKIPLFDKLALINRKFLPSSLVEWLLINSIHKKDTYTSEAMRKIGIMKEYAALID